MNVGLPGTGIGGMFYLLSALCMPVVETIRAVRRRQANRWGLVLRQVAMAAGIGAGLWVTGWLLAVVLASSPAALSALHGAGMGGRLAPNVLRTATMAISLATLGMVIVGVWVLKIVVHGWRSPALALPEMAGATADPSEEPAIRKVGAA
ncbi:MAG: hypothetical protein HY700_09405 [Gemmatimonadetes bacterium]|nr:hypothetical protein [Gemmatimonadota bacterium]